MTIRNVDSTVLLDLARATGRARGDLEARFNAARQRVDSAPGGWDRGRWDGIPSFIRVELESLEREQHELVDRAAKVDLAAAVRDLPDPLPTSALRFLLSVLSGSSGFAFYLAGGAVSGLVTTVAAFTNEFSAKNGRPPAAVDFAGLKTGMLGLDSKTAGASAQLKPLGDSSRPDRGYASQVVVNGKPLTDAEIADRGRAIRQAYQDKVGRQPTDSEYSEALRSGKSTSEIGDGLRNSAVRAALKLASSGEYIEDVKSLYGTIEPYPRLKQSDGSFVTPTAFDCVTFAGAVFLAMGIPSTAIPGRGGGLVNSDPDDWSEGWVEEVEPHPGAYVRVGDRHSLVYLGAIDKGYVIAESNFPTGSGPHTVVIDSAGKLVGNWDESMGEPTDERGAEAAKAIDLRYTGSPVFGSYRGQ